MTSNSSKSTLFQLLTGLRHFGVGAKVRRSLHVLPNTHYIITKVLLSKDQLHGKVWGRLVWRGNAKDKTERLGSPLKKEWSVVQLPDYKTFTGQEKEINDLIIASKVENVTAATASN